MWSRLIAAATSGDCNALVDLLHYDSKILEKFPMSSGEIPLHLASMFGHVDFVRKILEISPSTSMKQLIQLNPDGFSPMHLAVSNGHVELIMLFLEFGQASSTGEEVCMKKDRDGRTPLHSACTRGDIDVVSALLAACPEAVFELTVQEETILHLAVKYNQCEVFSYLVEQLNFGEFLNFPDGEGNTVLHLAAARKQFQTIEYLIRQTKININAVNSYGLTGLDVLIMYSSNSNELKIAEMIRYAGGKRMLNRTQNLNCTCKLVSREETNHIFSNDHKEIQNNSMPDSSGLIVMASLIATACFEITINTPGGYWQEWDPNSNNTTSSGATPAIHKPGNAILFDLDHRQFKCFLFCNTQVFLAAVSVIIFLITPRSMKHESTRLLVARLAVLVLVIMFMILFYETQNITTKGQSPAEPRAIVSWVFWSTLNICFALSPFVPALSNMLSKSRKQAALLSLD